MVSKMQTGYEAGDAFLGPFAALETAMRQRFDQLLVMQKSFEANMQRPEADFEQKVNQFNEQKRH